MSPTIAATNLLDSTEFIIGTVSLVAVLLGGAIVLWALDRWRKKQDRLANESTESLTNFRALFERGEISEEEYRRIRDRVSNQMRREVGLPAPPPQPEAEVKPAPDPQPAKPPEPAL
jgi:hypothetical protein